MNEKHACMEVRHIISGQPFSQRYSWPYKKLKMTKAS